MVLKERFVQLFYVFICSILGHHTQLGLVLEYFGISIKMLLSTLNCGFVSIAMFNVCIRILVIVYEQDVFCTDCFFAMSSCYELYQNYMHYVCLLTFRIIVCFLCL